MGTANAVQPQRTRTLVFGGHDNEPGIVGLCAQGIFQAFSGIANSLTGFRKLKPP
jgi:hypothetical protein